MATERKISTNDKGLTLEKLRKCAEELKKADKAMRITIDGVDYYKIGDINGSRT